MTVAELISRLSEFPPNHIMHIFDSETGDYVVIYDIDYTIALDNGVVVYV